jgi:predicted permease
MAAAGFYLHRRQFVGASGKKALARMSQQVTIPCLFFTKIVDCPQNFSADKCPSFTDNLSDVWVLLFWPVYVVACGLLVGELAARISSTPKRQRPSVLAACAFANSTGLPITLLTVIHSNFPVTSEIGKVDPNLFLSVYLILYPVLQWGVGGWLLSPSESNTYQDSEMNALSSKDSGVDLESKNSEAASTMIEELSLDNVLEHTHPRTNTTNSSLESEDDSFLPRENITEQAETVPKHSNRISQRPFKETILTALPKAFQPPVIAALVGLFISAFIPLRGIFVDLHDRDDDAPLEWLFDGLQLIGQAAIPINMCILGINLSITSQMKPSPSGYVSGKTITAIIVAKMIIMPCIGILTAIILKNYIWNIPDAIDGPFYLVLMIVTITPTANTVMVMVELSDGEAKEGMARIICMQYTVAPVLLSISVMCIVQVATLW